jgi:predicted ATP-binding protein involved in virulence
MIKSISVRNLNSRMDLDIDFNSDINLLTGKNGSSKTTLLKLIWFLNGGQIYNLLNEINFEYAELITDKAKATVERDLDKGNVKIQINDGQPQTINEEELRQLNFRHPRFRKALNEIRTVSEPTIFFPTFRRIEGGFSTGRERNNDPFSSNSLKAALHELSESLSMVNQRFVASISTDDLVILITKEYARITEEVNKIQKSQSDSIISKIQNRPINMNEGELLDTIQKEIEETEELRKSKYRPFSTLSELIQKIFQHKGIYLSNLAIGDVGSAISSEKLSAGEKQMLSFLCYNTFTRNSAIFIDEPELSLHPDWQRTLVPTLLAQGNENQFFMATHSPFIYAKYPDKEIMLGDDRGDN